MLRVWGHYRCLLWVVFMTLNAERFLLYGIEGSGKSECWISVLLDHPDKPNFYVLDTDGSATYSITDLGDEAALKRCRIWDASDPMGALITPIGKVEYYPTQWQAIAEATKQIRKLKPKPDEWLVIDRVDPLFEAVQNFWIEGAYGSDVSAYWAEIKREQEAANGGTARDYGGFMGARDWVPIKKAYHDVVRGLLSLPRVNKIVVALAKPPFAQSAKAAEQTELYGSLMPAGEANQGAEYFTILQVAKHSSGTHRVFVRRTKKRGGIGEVKNDKPVPIEITGDDGRPEFYERFIKLYFVGE